MGQGQAPRGIVLLYRDRVGRCGRRPSGCGGRRARRGRCWHWGRRHRLRRRCHDCARWSITVIQRRIEQHRVFPHEPPFGPVQLQQEIQKRFAHRVFSGDLDVIRAALGGHDFKAQTQQYRVAGDAGTLELGGIGQLGRH